MFSPQVKKVKIRNIFYTKQVLSGQIKFLIEQLSSVYFTVPNMKHRWYLTIMAVSADATSCKVYFIELHSNTC